MVGGDQAKTKPLLKYVFELELQWINIKNYTKHWHFEALNKLQ